MRTIIIERGHEVKPYQYEEQTDIGKVIIHEGARIGHCAFVRCGGITHINIAEGVLIGNSAFYECTGITHLNIAEDATIGGSAFYECTSITELAIAKGVTIREYAFDYCTGIIEVNIANDATIASAAFAYCTGITEVNIAKGVTIGVRAFDGCTGITELNIAESVRVNGKPFSFYTVERFSMPKPIMYFSRKLMLSISELFETLRNKGHEEFNINITQRSLTPYQGIQSLQSLCVKTIVGSDGIKDLSMANSIIRSQQLLASEETKKQRLFILERNDKCTKENCKANELYAMIQTHK